MSRAVIYETFGGPEVLELRNVPQPHAGVVDEVGGGVTRFAVGDRVYGGALGRAAADFVVVKTPTEALWHTPDGIGDEVASTLPVAGLTAAAAVAAIDLRAGDTDLVGTETAETALAVGVPSERISTIAARPNPPGGVHAPGAIDARPDAMERITEAIIAGKITVPIAATFPIEQIRDSVRRQAGRHVHGKIAITLRRRLR